MVYRVGSLASNFSCHWSSVKEMKKRWVILLFFAGLVLTYFAAKTFRGISVEAGAAEITTKHFLISYSGIFKDEAQSVADSLESNYNRVRTDLDDPHHEVIHVFIHPNQKDFNKGTGLLNSTANGTSRGPNEFHVIWTTWYNSVFPDDPIKTAIHEFTHCVQLNILIKQAQKELTNEGDFDKAFEQKFLNDYPQWFWEAICDYEAGVVNSVSVKYGMSKGLTLKELNKSNQIYNVGYTIIEFIVDRWDKGKLGELVVSYVDIEKVLSISETDFEKAWIDFVSEKY